MRETRTNRKTDFTSISPSTPPRFALSLADHVVGYTARTDLQGAYPVGTTLEAVKVARVESERGLIMEVASGVEGFVHVRALFCFSLPFLIPS